ncbi:MAG TPA: hypothetical protein IAD23_07750 [Candidatus Scubalenecus merdavium]|uniref:Uncharacterized protein n=1 Tax=Candidatus Scybalenecus merdavium TaxID=2840939 RepID=A0A9D1MVL2_9FIRM|nr:hypothetical protein [Candidatus Scubalenecus merdavium]
MKKSYENSHFELVKGDCLQNYGRNIVQVCSVSEDSKLYLCELRGEHETERVGKLKKRTEDITFGEFRNMCRKNMMVLYRCDDCDYFYLCHNIRNKDVPPSQWNLE